MRCLAPIRPRLSRRHALGGLLLAAALASLRRASAQDQAAPDGLMAPVRQRYASLASYGDSGTIETAYQWPGSPALAETHRFETAFRAPRHFFFRFEQDAAAGGDVFVIWCDGGPFQSWWKASGVHEVYDGGRGSLAFALAASPTKDSANLVAPFFFAAAELKGPVINLIAVEQRGEEAVAGRPCRVLSAAGRDSGMGPEERSITVWVDKDEGLVRKIFLDTAAGQTAGLIDRITYALDPVANPALPDARFAFVPPG